METINYIFKRINWKEVVIVFVAAFSGVITVGYAGVDDAVLRGDLKGAAVALLGLVIAGVSAGLDAIVQMFREAPQARRDAVAAKVNR